MTDLAQQTLANIVTCNHSSVPVLEKYELDFCCKGKRTLRDACSEKGLPLDNILKELESSGIRTSTAMPFTEMSPEQLISYILIHHHFYVKQSMPAIISHLEKVASKHGERFPHMVEVFSIFREVAQEMTMHMHKEEVILFPRIKEVAALVQAHQHRNLMPAYIAAPIQVMEHEHDHAGEMLYNIRRLTNNYTTPAGACTTFQVCLAELKEFEEDLHKHVHLENNILFPLAEKLLSEQLTVN